MNAKSRVFRASVDLSYGKVSTAGLMSDPIPRRRVFMKNILRAMKLDLVALLLLSLTLVFSGCSGDSKSSKKLYIFNWTYYTPDSVIEKFEKEYGVDVVYDSFASNEEMFAKLKAGGANYDLCFPSGDYVSIMIKEKMLQKIDNAALKNYGNIAPEVLDLNAAVESILEGYHPFLVCMPARGLVSAFNRLCPGV